MARLLVSENTLVDYGDERWRLIRIDSENAPTLLAEARAGRNFRYDDYFGTTRALPPLGEVATREIGHVALGWSDRDDAWQLGMTLSPQLSFTRGSRWFEVLRIAHPDGELAATQIGQALANVLGVPFVPIQATEPLKPPPPPLVDLPLDLGLWQVEAGPDPAQDAELRLTRKRAWLKARWRSIAWYGALAIVYLWISLGSLGSDLGLPGKGTLIPLPFQLPLSGIADLDQPVVIELPHLGIVVFVLLLALIARQLLMIRRRPDTLLFGGERITAWRGTLPRWQLDLTGVQSVYISELVKKRGKRMIVFHGEINLQRVDGTFRRVLVEDDKRQDAALPGVDVLGEKSRQAGVSALGNEDAGTALQAAGLHIGAALGGLPVFYDRRFK